MAGSDFSEIDVGKVDRHLEPTARANIEALKEVKSSHFQRSETQKITAVFVENRQVYLCDAPGFGDTLGPEVDIANGIGITRAAKLCASVKPVVIISNRGLGDKGEGVTTIAKTLFRFVPNIQDIRNSFSYMFTKFINPTVVKNQLKEIHSEFKKKDRTFSSDLMDDIMKKVADNVGGPIVVKPLEGKADDLWKVLMKPTEAIYSPENSFEVFVSPESYGILQEQISLLCTSTEIAIRKMNIPLIAYNLRQLNTLKTLLAASTEDTVDSKNKMGCSGYQQCLLMLTSLIRTSQGNFTKSLERVKSERNTYSEIEITSLLSDFRQLVLLNPVCCEFLADGFSDIIDIPCKQILRMQSDFDQLIQADFVKMSKHFDCAVPAEPTPDIQSSIAESLSSSEHYRVDDAQFYQLEQSSILQRLNKMLYLAFVMEDKYFSLIGTHKMREAMRNKYINIVLTISNRIKELLSITLTSIADALKDIDTAKMSTFIVKLRTSHFFLEICKGHIDKDKELYVSYENLNRNLIEHLELCVLSYISKVTDSEQQYQNDKVCTSDYIPINVGKLINFLERVLLIGQNLFGDSILLLQNKLLDHCVTATSGSCNTILSCCLNAATVTGMNLVPALVYFVNDLRSTLVVKNRTIEIYLKTSSAALEFVQYTVQQTIEMLNSASSLLTNLSFCLTSLAIFSTLPDDFVSYQCSMQYETVLKIMDSCSISILEKVTQWNLSTDNIAETLHIFSEVKRLKLLVLGGENCSIKEALSIAYSQVNKLFIEKIRSLITNYICALEKSTGERLPVAQPELWESYAKLLDHLGSSSIRDEVEVSKLLMSFNALLQSFYSKCSNLLTSSFLQTKASISKNFDAALAQNDMESPIDFNTIVDDIGYVLDTVKSICHFYDNLHTKTAENNGRNTNLCEENSIWSMAYTIMSEWSEKSSREGDKTRIGELRDAFLFIEDKTMGISQQQLKTLHIMAQKLHGNLVAYISDEKKSFATIAEIVYSKIKELNLGLQSSIEVAIQSVSLIDLNILFEESKKTGVLISEKIHSSLKRKIIEECTHLSAIIERFIFDKDKCHNLILILKKMSDVHEFVSGVLCIPFDVKKEALELLQKVESQAATSVIQSLDCIHSNLEKGNFLLTEKICAAVEEVCSFFTSSLKNVSEKLLHSRTQISKHVEKIVSLYERPCELLVQANLSQEIKFADIESLVSSAALVIYLPALKKDLKPLTDFAKADEISTKPEKGSNSSYGQIVKAGVRAGFEKLTGYSLQPKPTIAPKPACRLAITPVSSGLKSHETTTFKGVRVFYFKKSTKTYLALETKNENFLDCELCKRLLEAGSITSSRVIMPSDMLRDTETEFNFSHIPLDFNMMTTLNPAVVIREMRSAQELKGSNKGYASAIERLEKYFSTQLLTLLQTCSSWDKSSAMQNVEMIRSILPYLPPHISNTVSSAIAICITHIENAVAKYTREMETFYTSENILSAIHTLEDAFNNRRLYELQNYYKDVEEYIVKRFKELEMGLDKEFCNAIAVLEMLPTIFGWALALHRFRQKCGDNTLNIYATRKNWMHDAVKCFFDHLEKKITRSTDILSERELFQSQPIPMIQTILMLVANSLNFRITNKIFYDEWLYWSPNVLGLRIPRGVASICKGLETFLNKLENAFTTDVGDVKNLATLLSTSKNIDPVLMDLAKYAAATIFDNMDKSVIVMLSNFQRYSYFQNLLTNVVRDHISKLKEPLVGLASVVSNNFMDRDSLFKVLSGCFSFVIDCNLYAGEHLVSILNIESSIPKIEDHLIRELTMFKEEVLKIIETLIPDQIIVNPETLYQKMSNLCDNFRSIRENFLRGNVFTKASVMYDDVNRSVDIKLGAFKKKLQSDTGNHAVIVKMLLILKIFEKSCPTFQSKVNNFLNTSFCEYQTLANGTALIGALGVLLNSHPDPTGRMIISSHTAFKSYANYLRNQETLQFSVKNVLEKLKGDKLDKRKLLTFYTEFDKLYWDLVESGLSSGTGETEKVKFSIVEKAKQIAIDKECKHSQKIVALMAHLFAYWTLFTSLDDFHAGNASVCNTSPSSKRMYLMQPHAAQVVSIFRLFGLDDNNEIGGMAEIFTGEGKSVTLAITSAILALLGNNVHCACFSVYLSSRDYEAFRCCLFLPFGVQRFIKYGTFSGLCENFINKNGSVRKMTEEIISKDREGFAKSLPGRSEITERPTILAIDEVDVFFSKDFYGSYYSPRAKIYNDKLFELAKYIYDCHTAGSMNLLPLRIIKQSKQFLTCLDQFHGWENLLEEALKGMLTDVRKIRSTKKDDKSGKVVPNHQYEVVDGRIGYKDQDSISFDQVYGYLTMFASFIEHANDKISDTELKKHVAMVLSCGTFSYAEVPKKYAAILGVTGTLHTLTKMQRAILRDEYKITKSTYMPSVYGDNQLDFQEDNIKGIQLESKKDYFTAIRRVINEITRLDRAILVFFENTVSLNTFYTDPIMADKRGFVKVMIEQTPMEVKKNLILSAATKGNIVLLTREFGRGTDFVCYDTALNKIGGVHVLQTFLSEEVSEEIQIKGRTARQGKVGSFSMVLDIKELEKFGIVEDPAQLRYDISEIKKKGELYSKLNEKRIKYFDEVAYPRSIEEVSTFKEKHTCAVRFLYDLLAGRSSEVKSFLITQNAVKVSESKPTRTLILMDATGSMGGLIDKSKICVDVMFQRANQMIEEKCPEKIIEIQFACYRNYDVGANTLMQISSWERNPDNLRDFMHKVVASGGTHWEEAGKLRHYDIVAGLAVTS